MQMFREICTLCFFGRVSALFIPAEFNMNEESREVKSEKGSTCRVSKLCHAVKVDTFPSNEQDPELP